MYTIDPDLVRTYADQIAAMIEHAQQEESSTCDYDTIEAIAFICRHK